MLVLSCSLFCLLQRRQREYLSLDFEQLLEDKGIDTNLLMPSSLDSGDEPGASPFNPVFSYLPLEVTAVGFCLLWPACLTLTHLSNVFSRSYSTTMSTTAVPQRTGSPWADVKGHLI